MIEFFRKIFGQPGSSSTAKERLRLVLMSDHLTLAPEMIDKLKSDLVDVISKYVEVDRDKIEVNFEEHDKALAMLANIPILSVNRPNSDDDSGTGGGGEREPDVPAATVQLPRRKRRKRSQSGGSTASGNPAPAT
jgi:cell division topological specificity factor